ncbi:MAG: hypothetical protein RIC93_07330 [Alphaproteobacteria bacterium]
MTESEIDIERAMHDAEYRRRILPQLGAESAAVAKAAPQPQDRCAGSPAHDAKGPPRD